MAFHQLSRRQFLAAGVAAGAALALPSVVLGRNDSSRDVLAISNMIKLNLFGDVLHCVGGCGHLAAIKLFLGIHRSDHFSQIARTDSGDITTTLLKTANGKTVTLYDDRSASRPYGGMFRVEGTRGIWMQDVNKIYLRDVSPIPDAWEDFAPYRAKYGQYNNESDCHAEVLGTREAGTPSI